MPNYDDHAEVIQLLKEAQDAEHDNRERVREAHLFVDKRDGQWEPEWWEACDGKPRYTFDQVSPLIDQVMGVIEQSEFAIQVDPRDNQATEDNAEVLKGLVRNIERESDAVNRVYKPSARGIVKGGLDGWRVVQKYVDQDSFDQELVIENIHNYNERVWFNCGVEEPDGKGAKHCFVMSAMPKKDYEYQYPDGAGMSVQQDRSGTAYFQKANTVIIGQLYYIKEEKRTLGRTNRGRVFDIDSDEFKQLRDELEADGEVIEEERKRPKQVVYSRIFDGSGFLTDPQKTVFSMIPVVQGAANWSVIEDKPVYRGIVEKLFDAQRVLNYAESRKIEEGAYAPRAKYWATEKQIKGHEDTLATLNTNSDPVQTYNVDPSAPNPPQQQGGAQINPGLSETSEQMKSMIATTAGMFDANMGANPALQSGVAIDSLQQQGNIGNATYVTTMELAITRTAMIIIDAIPKVYTGQRQIRILGEDGVSEFVTLNQLMLDQQTGKPVVLNDLSRGKFDVTVSAGMSYKNKQQETVAGITNIGAIDPSIIEIGSDILLSNMTSPGMDEIAKRKRQQLLQAGIVPMEQMTEEEQQQAIQAAQQPPQPDPAALIAQAEMGKAQAQQAQAEAKAQEAIANVQLQAQKQQQDMQKAGADLQLQADNQQFQQQMEIMQLQLKQQELQMKNFMETAKLELQYQKDINRDGAVGEVPPIQLSYNPETGAMTQR